MVEWGDLDLAVLFREPAVGIVGGIVRGVAGEPAAGEVIERLRRVWVGAPGLPLAAEEPVPLVLFDAPRLFRNAALGALDGARRSWRLVLSTPSLSGIRAAVRAGLGVSVRTDYWLEPDVRILDGTLPPLPDVELALIAAPDAGEVVMQRLRIAPRAALTRPRIR